MVPSLEPGFPRRNVDVETSGTNFQRDAEGPQTSLNVGRRRRPRPSGGNDEPGFRFAMVLRGLLIPDSFHGGRTPATVKEGQLPTFSDPSRPTVAVLCMPWPLRIVGCPNSTHSRAGEEPSTASNPDIGIPDRPSDR